MRQYKDGQQHEGIGPQVTYVGPGGKEHGQVGDVLIVRPDRLSYDVTQDAQAKQKRDPSLGEARRRGAWLRQCASWRPHLAAPGQPEWQRQQQPNPFEHSLREIVDQDYHVRITRFIEQVGAKEPTKQEDQGKTFAGESHTSLIHDLHHNVPSLNMSRRIDTPLFYTQSFGTSQLRRTFSTRVPGCHNYHECLVTSGLSNSLCGALPRPFFCGCAVPGSAPRHTHPCLWGGAAFAERSWR